MTQLSFSADPLPPINATLKRQTGKFSFRPEKAEAYVITFIVTDSKGKAAIAKQSQST